MRSRRVNLKLAFVALLSLLLLFVTSGQAQERLCAIAANGIDRASEIRGLAVKKKVPCLVHDREQIKQFLLETIDTKIPPERLAGEERVFKALGIIPSDFRYKEGIIELYLSQIGGYYDPERDHFVMAAWMPASLQTAIAVHEMTHALQDQYFDLQRFVPHDHTNSDALMARSALVEGDATAVMSDYSRALLGQGPLAQEKGVEALMLQNVLGAGLVAGMAQVPQALQMILIFPYTSGLRFAHHLLRQGGYEAIDHAFRNPPRSTEEILHPEKFGSEMPDFDLLSVEEVRGDVVPAELEARYEDVLGEFSISAMLGNFLTDKAQAAEAASGWGGDRVVIFEADGAPSVVGWLTRWDTERDAQQFFTAMQRALQARNVSTHESVAKLGDLPSGAALLNRTGRDVRFLMRE